MRGRDNRAEITGFGKAVFLPSPFPASCAGFALLGRGTMALTLAMMVVAFVVYFICLQTVEVDAAQGSRADSAETLRAPVPAETEGELAAKAVRAPAPLFQDLVRQTVRALHKSNYSYRHEVTTGRFLADFERSKPLADAIRPDELELHLRGEGWMLLDAPLRSPTARGRSRARMRLVETEGEWKVENIRALRRVTPTRVSSREGSSW